MNQLQVIKRDGSVAAFDPEKIRAALVNAFLKDENGNYWSSRSTLSAAEQDKVKQLTSAVVAALSRTPAAAVHIEAIQDQVELALMRAAERKIAAAYVLYRQKRAEKRTDTADMPSADQTAIILADGTPLPVDSLKRVIDMACAGLNDVSAEAVLTGMMKNLYPGVPAEEVEKSMTLAARTLMEQEPNYSKVTARLLLHIIRKEVVGQEVMQDDCAAAYVENFPRLIQKGIDAGLLDARLAQFNLPKLALALNAERDMQFGFIGLQTLYDRYFLHVDGTRIELPQTFYMRVAMGLALDEIDREARAIEFYDVLSSFDFMVSTPTLFNSGTVRSQLSSCYLTTVADDLSGIYDAIKENALLAKYAGGLGNDWTPVRALGSHIKGTNGKSQGVVPFLKVANDTAVAVNQGGKRKGAVCAYLETWHMDIEEFLDLRKNTGDDRRRTHDMNTANWVPDLFMKRVMANEDWTLFSPSEVPELHETYGERFEQIYCAYEAKAVRGEIRVFKKISAQQLWRKMLTMLFETGHPWITFKDPCNIRSPQQHVGVVHSSNLCTEITLNTSESEIAVCNLGSVNLAAHLSPVGLNLEKLQKTTSTAMRMLDNVINLNYYSVPKARNSNLQHRPVGLGIMGFQDCLYAQGIAYGSDEAVEFADFSMEAVSFYAYLASTDLAKERGRYPSFTGSLWDQGVLPLDSIDMLANERGGYVDVHREVSGVFDWDIVRTRIKQYGMRNSNCLAIAPTATISNIIGVSASIEPTYQNLYVKSNLSGEFTEFNEYLVQDLKARGLWDEVMVSDLKYFEGDVSKIDRIPKDLQAVYATAFQVDPKWLVEAASRRQKWIDQAQSLNIYMAGASGKKLDELYKFAWVKGLKTTYYLRTMGASHAEKATLPAGSLNAVKPVVHVPVSAIPSEDVAGPVCTMRPGDPGFEECEACQ